MKEYRKALKAMPIAELNRLFITVASRRDNNNHISTSDKLIAITWAISNKKEKR